jgi:hypothetical protein
MESLVTEIVGIEVNECCDRSGRPKCCFKIHDAGRAMNGRPRRRA